MSILERIQERFSADVVFGDPVETQDGVVVPAARVMGGGGGGSDKEGDEGGGFGLSARPAGAWVIKDGDATWKPAVDLSMIVAAAVVVAVSFFFFQWRIAKARAKFSSG